MEQARKSTYIIAAIALVILTATIYFLFIFQKGSDKLKSQESVGEVKSISDLEVKDRPYITLTPTADGAEIIISVENMSSFDKIEYELTYLADNPQVAGEKIERGSTGTDVNTKDVKYKKSILLGTASRGTRSPDTGVTDGVLSLHLFRGDTEYLSESQWDFLEAGASVKDIADRDGNIQIENLSLAKNYWIIIADTVGFPPQPSFEPKDAVFPIKGAFSIAPQFTKQAKLTLKVKDDISSPVLYSYREDSGWKEQEADYDSSQKSLTSPISSLAAFAVVGKAQ